MSYLAEKHCVPCGDKDFPPLTKEQAADLMPHIPEWKVNAGATEISREFGFKDFWTALTFVNRVGKLAEEENHHPDIALSWGKVGIRLSTHEIKGLSENDFVLAVKIDLIQQPG